MKYLVITRTVTVKQKLAVVNYPDMTVAEAIEFETGAEKDDKVGAMVESIAFAKDDELSVTVSVDVVDEDNLGEVTPA